MNNNGIMMCSVLIISFQRQKRTELKSLRILPFTWPHIMSEIQGWILLKQLIEIGLKLNKTAKELWLSHKSSFYEKQRNKQSECVLGLKTLSIFSNISTSESSHLLGILNQQMYTKTLDAKRKSFNK